MLRKLEECYGVSGMEAQVCSYLKNALSPFCTRLWEDSMGSLHAEKKADKDAKNILIAAYMDEPGIIITRITEDGYLKFETVGRIDAAFLVSKRVCIHGIDGIISLKAIHLATKKERETPVKADQLLIDIGASSREEAEQAVEIGDYGAFDSRFQEFGDGFVKGRALAGRAGCAVASEILQNDWACNLHVIFAVQREIGNRGMAAAAWESKADMTVVLDGTEARIWAGPQDRPEAGRGAVLLLKTGAGTALQTELQGLLEEAEHRGIPVQTYYTGEKGQETVLRQTGYGHHCLCLGIPVRYSKTTAQVASISDMQAMREFVKLVIEQTVKQEETK